MPRGGKYLTLFPYSPVFSLDRRRAGGTGRFMPIALTTLLLLCRLVFLFRSSCVSFSPPLTGCGVIFEGRGYQALWVNCRRLR